MSRRTLGVVLAVVAAALAVVGTFLPFSWIGLGLDLEERNRFGFTTTGWSTITEPADMGGIGTAAQYGVPIVIAAVLLLVAAALVFLPAHQRVAARYTAIGATGVLAGSVWTTFMVVSATLTPGGFDTRATVEYRWGAGVWLLVASVVVAVAATVFLHARPPLPAPAGPVVHRIDGDDGVDGDTDTPPFGVPVAVLPAGYLEQSGAESGPESESDRK